MNFLFIGEIMSLVKAILDDRKSQRDFDRVILEKTTDQALLSRYIETIVVREERANERDAWWQTNIWDKLGNAFDGDFIEKLKELLSNGV